jgi:hypothetical protein
MASFLTNLSSAQVQAKLDELRLAYISGVLEIRFADGKTQRYQSSADMLKAIQTTEDWLRQMNGQGGGSSVSFAQHKRGDGPSGPGRCFGR